MLREPCAESDREPGREAGSGARAPPRRGVRGAGVRRAGEGSVPPAAGPGQGARLGVRAGRGGSLQRRLHT